ncbi:MAG TPA: hypothetical protein VKA64_08965 [Gammaproteobacteria bacterium]|nr:hypothetical protein [Gammaproteobacteria bacterium]
MRSVTDGCDAVTDPETLQLSLTPERIERYCRDTERSARDTAHALSALVAVQTFLSTQVEPGQEAYGTIRAILAEHIDRVQEKLLDEGAKALLPALRRRDAAAVGRIHGPLSRSGFHTALERAWGELDPAERAGVADWAAAWCRDARARGEAASGYPDAPDLAAAGIDLQEYAALGDVAGFTGR